MFVSLKQILKDIRDLLKEIADDVKAIRQVVVPRPVARFVVTIDPPTKQ